MICTIITLNFLLYWTSVLAEDNGVFQIPSVLWHKKGESAEMKCSHNKGFGYIQMYWYRQRQGESMEFIVYKTASGEPEFGSVDKNKFSTVKNIAANGSLTVKDLDIEDSAVYFCAVFLRVIVLSRVLLISLATINNLLTSSVNTVYKDMIKSFGTDKTMD
ncbi:hypothetical protein QTP70_002638 [Hemibagrus guttatus]|uniref:Ig-like domain-containing protein n=1 Tax=Hemibagrus guttatus TaxID=175788 RepID=A0AAE0QZL3_9TELE|nr:hypothetical protein QTP70_002638 [Hemibagrus guttatus]